MVTTFGEDELGITQVVDTARSESGADDYDDRSGKWSRATQERVTTRGPKSYKNRRIIVWRPDVSRIQRYIGPEEVPARLAELLRTVPTVNLESYGELFGITILKIEGVAKPENSTGVTVGDGVEIPYEARDKTVYVLGRPGMGKSTLLLSMTRQDILAGKGVGVIDPHGELVRDLLPYIPRSRVKDVIFFDPTEVPIGINFFSAADDNERARVASDVITLFGRFASVTGERMDAILHAVAHTLAEWPEATFLDIYYLLYDDYFRDTVVRTLRNKALVNYWKDVYPKLPHPSSEQPILNRMNRFAINRKLATITGSHSSLNFWDVIQQRKILLCSIPKTTLGADVSGVVGAMLVSQFQLAALRQGALPPKQRIPFYLYIDEFQNFQTSAFNEIMTEARKFQLCLTLANQKLSDLDDATRSAIQGAETSIYFRPVDEDASKIARSLPSFDAATLLDLDQWQAIVRQGKVTNSLRVEIDPPPKPPSGYATEIIEQTKASYRSDLTTRASAAEEQPKGTADEPVEPSDPPE
jgi:hypothetical protein